MLERLELRGEKLAVIGLGYVGLPLAAAFSKYFSVIGYDRDANKIASYRAGKDPTGERAMHGTSADAIDFTCDERRLREASFLVVAVPTPINGDKTPDLTPLKEATLEIGRNLRRDSIVVYESTVYPGVTEDICCPLLEEVSGLRAGVDFRVGYSLERINPRDRVNRLENIVKIVSGMDADTLKDVAEVYGTIIEKTPLGQRSCNPSSIKGIYKSHFSLSDLYFLHPIIRWRCSFNSGDAICVGALMYGGLPIVMSKPPSFEGRLRHTQKSMIDAIIFPSFLQAIYRCMKPRIDKISVEGGF